MKKTLLIMAFGLSSMLMANPANQTDHRQKTVHAKQKAEKRIRKHQERRPEKKRHRAERQWRDIKRYRHLKRRHAKRRHFRDRRDFERYRHHRRADYRHLLPRNIIAYRDFDPFWYRGYRYERLPFFDRYGYFYGYFNEIGYFFEGIFYRYDRYYTYRDRLRGRGLFDHFYYRPFR